MERIETNTKWKAKGSYFKVHTEKLLKEIFNCPGTGVLSIPLNRLGDLLYQVGERCAEINDPILNQLMCDLAIYSEADQADKENYNSKKVNQVRKEYDKFYGKQKRIPNRPIQAIR